MVEGNKPGEPGFGKVGSVEDLLGRMDDADAQGEADARAVEAFRLGLKAKQEGGNEDAEPETPVEE